MSSNVPMKVFFVVGAARSGTTLITRLLSAHPRIHLHHERRVLELAAVAGGLRRTGGHSRGDATPTAAQNAADVLAGRRFAMDVLRAGTPPGTVWFGDKYPPYAGQVGALAASFPGCRILHIVRDGRSVVASWLHTWARDHAWRRGPRPPAPAVIAKSWAASVDRADDAGATLSPDQYMAFRYEDLLESPLETGRRLVEFLDEEAVPEFIASLEELSPRGDWRRDLSPAEVAEVESEPAARAALTRWDYALTGAPAPPPDTVDACLETARRALAAQDVPAARTAWLRVLRLHPRHQEAARCLMALVPRRGEALFGLMHLARDTSEAATKATGELLQARGLSPAATASLLSDRDPN
jgi:hypothetical protein